jgi:uncharacterized protein (UPF0333 family)|tara:strand:+ start:224 stop:388 length:165 start_codon:yes stop_codon:yes gene_type:complete
MTIALVIFSIIFWFVLLNMIKKDLQARGQNEKLINNMNRYDNDREKKENGVDSI